MQTQSNHKELVITARIIQSDPAKFMVIVSTSNRDPMQADYSGRTWSGHATTLETATALREEMIPKVQNAALRRGHHVADVERLGPG